LLILNNLPSHNKHVILSHTDAGNVWGKVAKYRQFMVFSRARWPMKSQPRIALLVKTNSEWHRSVLMGVAQCAEDNGFWDFTIPEVGPNDEVALPANWKGDGIIFRATSRALEESVRRANVPCVNISWLQSSVDIPKVVSDERACAELAAQNLLEKQYENFGYVSFPPWCHYSDMIERTLAEQLQRRGYELNCYSMCGESRKTGGINIETMHLWLKSLRKPVAIVVWSSVVGHLVAKACRECDFPIPNSVAILCIEHDHLWSTLAPVPLSNIDQDPWRIGYLAAKLLNRMIKGEPPPSEPILVPPICVMQRRSTEASVVKDPVLKSALDLIYEQAKTGITVKEVVATLGVSRRALEAKFQRYLDCTPAAYIRRIQLSSVARLLRTTKLSISAIAHRTGYLYPEVLMRAFKREFGVTPMQFRGAGRVNTATKLPVKTRPENLDHLV
jgi:LacI family transcriptional regulator